MEEQKFEPYQKVLVRDREHQRWFATFFSHKIEGNTLPYITTSGVSYRFCLPYEGNEHLVGATDSPKPKWEPKPGELVAVWGNDPKHVVAREYVKKSADGNFVCLYGGYMEDRHGLEAEWQNCAPLRKHFNIPDEE